jgi:hypothetical protein
MADSSNWRKRRPSQPLRSARRPPSFETDLLTSCLCVCAVCGVWRVTCRAMRCAVLSEVPHYCAVSKAVKRFSAMANAAEDRLADIQSKGTHFDLSNATVYCIEVYGSQALKPECHFAIQLQCNSQVTIWAAGSDEARLSWLQALCTYRDGRAVVLCVLQTPLRLCWCLLCLCLCQCGC